MNKWALSNTDAEYKNEGAFNVDENKILISSYCKAVQCTLYLADPLHYNAAGTPLNYIEK